MADIYLTIPGTDQEVILRVAGEIHFGPEYYTLSINETSLENRYFGNCYRLAEDLKCFLIQEWQTIDYLQGPQTCLTCFDILERKECLVDRAFNGFIEPIRFNSHIIEYRKVFHDRDVSEHYEIALPALMSWKPF